MLRPSLTAVPGMSSETVLEIRALSKRYASGLDALKAIDLQIQRGEIFALLGPNGAGKTTLISSVCGIVQPSSGTVLVEGQDHQKDYRAARRAIGLVPQELHTEAFERVIDTVRFSRGLFGLPPNEAYLEQVLRDLALWDKRHSQIMQLSGGMKRRVMIAKALAHEPRILFLDEPTAGVDVELRRSLWTQVQALRARGVTIILTTHYIEEAQELADRVGIIHRGEIVLVDTKQQLMRKLGRRQLKLQLQQPLSSIPEALSDWPLQLGADGNELLLTFDTHSQEGLVPRLLEQVHALGIGYSDLRTAESSLEDIFVDLVQRREAV